MNYFSFHHKPTIKSIPLDRFCVEFFEDKATLIELGCDRPAIYNVENIEDVNYLRALMSGMHNGQIFGGHE